jgi:hypothetical protein
LKRQLLALALTAALVLVLAPAGLSAQEDEDFGEDGGSGEETFVVTGYLSNQTGVFVDPASTKTYFYKFDPSLLVWGDDAGEVGKKAPPGYTEYPFDHGGKLGQLSMFRNTLVLKADWFPAKDVSLRAVFRGVRSLQLQADDQTQPPVPSDVNDKRAWARDNFYTENELRELYLAFDVTKRWNVRVGRQQVCWGEIGQYRLLDVVNPVDSTWHFSAFESFEDQRIPMWMLDTTFDLRALSGSLEAIWVPMLDKGSRTVTTPLTFVGAWGLPEPPIQTDKGQNPAKIGRKIFQYPDNTIEDSRAGLRWKGTAFNDYLNYSLVYFYGHQMTPPIPQYYISPYGDDPYFNVNGEWVRNLHLMDVYLHFPRQHTAGFSLEWALDNPIGAAFRVEAAVEPDRVFPVYSLATAQNYAKESSPGGDPSKAGQFLKPEDHRVATTADPHAAQVYMMSKKKNVLNYAVQIMRPTMIRWLNTQQNFTFVLQFMHSWVMDFDSAEHLVDVPGYDQTITREHDMKIVAVLFTNYLHGMLAPRLTAIYQPPPDWKGPGDAIINFNLGFVFGDHWRGALAANFFFAEDPYRGIGLFRDRDEINLKIMYQF